MYSVTPSFHVVKDGDPPAETFSIVPDWLTRKRLSGRALQVYSVLASFADRKTGQCWPSHRTIANQCGCSEDTVKRAIRELRKLGAVEVGIRVTQGGQQTSNLYTVIRKVSNSRSVGRGAKLHPLGGAKLHPKQEPVEQEGEEDYCVRNFVLKLRDLYLSLPAGISHDLIDPVAYFQRVLSDPHLQPFSVQDLKQVLEIFGQTRKKRLPLAIPHILLLVRLPELLPDLREIPMGGLDERIRRFCGDHLDRQPGDPRVLSLIAEEVERFRWYLQAEPTL